MRVLVAAAAFPSEMSGVQRHAFNLVRCLLLANEVSEVHLVVAPWQDRLIASAGLTPSGRLRVHHGDMKPGSLSRNFWYYRDLPPLAASLKVDIVHLTYPVPLRAAAFPCPVVSTLNDLYPYEIPLNFGLRQILFNRLILRQCLGKADAIVCISQATRERLGEYLPGRISKKATQIYISVEPIAECSSHSPIPGWHGEPFLLCIAQHRRNKNIPLLIRSFARLLDSRRLAPSTRLAVVGIAGPETPHIRRLIERVNLLEKVCLLEGLSEPELKWCYSHCEAVAAPSSTEGLGLPVAEALLAGCRVVCSDIPAFREFGGDHCRYVALGRDAEQNLADAIADALGAPTPSPVSLPQLSPSEISSQYLALYHKTIASPSSVYGTSVPGPATKASAERRLEWK